MKTNAKLLLIGLCFTYSFNVCFGQTFHLHKDNTCFFGPSLESMTPREYHAINATKEARKVIAELTDAIGFDPSDIELKVADVENALATIQDGKRYILYSHQFISQLDGTPESKWIVYSVFAHELAHHVRGHKFDEKDPRERKKDELDADKYAGTLLRMACCPSQKDAISGLSLLQNTTSENYPPKSERIEATASHWYDRDQQYLKGGGDPCGNLIELKFGKEFGSDNYAKNVYGRIKEGIIEITFDVTPGTGQSRFKSFLTTPRNSSLVPTMQNMEWITNPEFPGNRRQLLWYFGKDGYTKEQVEKSDQLGIAVFEYDNVPTPLEFWDYSMSTGLIMAGGISSGIGFVRKSDSDEFYDVYKDNRNPFDPIYQEPNLSREEMYDEANKLHKQSEWFKYVGYGLIGAGATWTVFKILEHRKGKIGNLYIGNFELKVDPGIFFDRGGR